MIPNQDLEIGIITNPEAREAFLPEEACNYSTTRSEKLRKEKIYIAFALVLIFASAVLLGVDIDALCNIISSSLNPKASYVLEAPMSANSSLDGGKRAPKNCN